MDRLSAEGVEHYAVQTFRATGSRPNRLSPVGVRASFDLPQNGGDRFREFCIR